MLTALILVAALATNPAPPDHRATLTTDVAEIAAPGVPGPLLITSDRAFAVVDGSVSKDINAPVVAAGRLGNGRFVAFGHTGYLGADSARRADTGRLLVNSVRWASGKGPAARVRVGSTNKSLAAYLAEQGLDAVHLDGRRWTDRIGDFDVVCCGQGRLDKPQVRKLQEYVAGGRGLVMGGLGWGWLQLNPGRTLRDHPGNRVLERAGVFWADGTLKRTTNDGYAVRDELSPMLNAMTALRAIGDGTLASAERAQAGWAASQAVRFPLRTDSELRDRIEALVDAHRGTVVPSKKKPIGKAKALERFVLTYEIEEAAKAATEDVRAHPAAAIFPGTVPDDAPRGMLDVTVDTARPQWHGTGLYAAPGEVVTVTVEPRVVAAGLSVRIGCHKDKIFHKDRWRRAPQVTRVAAVRTEVTRIACAFGGLVYIDVPKGCDLGETVVTIMGAVAAPRFVLGETSPDRWREHIRTFPAPWAELETSKVIITVPSSVVRELDDPGALMEFWDDVLDAAATLASRPRERLRPERYVADEQISAGYMHAGYPIMTHLDAAEHMVSVESLRQGRWGLYHELGHNHQSRDWTFAGTGEVTCNLFSLYIIDTLCTIPPGERGHRGATGDVGLDDYFAGGADFRTWKRKPFLALRMYIQLQERFGWEPFIEVFAEYRDLPGAERPKSDDEKRDQWLVRLSRTVGHDLGPFFEAWGVPTSNAARASLADLPPWMPNALSARVGTAR
ncbi:MAG: hypothetical protein GY715_13920 [Planctomycetes bacterium]|nr:hypothetical protein [Planctomycetota bacterium]